MTLTALNEQLARELAVPEVDDRTVLQRCYDYALGAVNGEDIRCEKTIQACRRFL